MRFSRNSSLTRRGRRRDSEKSSLRRSSPSVRGKFIGPGTSPTLMRFYSKCQLELSRMERGKSTFLLNVKIEPCVVHDEGLTSTGVPFTSDLCVLLGK